VGHVLVFHGSFEADGSGLHRLQGDHVFFRIFMIYFRIIITSIIVLKVTSYFMGNL
jgi:hypothetical protein